MALNDILTSMDGARDALVTAINAKGGSLADNATLYQCADAIGSLSGGTSAEYYKCASVTPGVSGAVIEVTGDTTYGCNGTYTIVDATATGKNRAWRTSDGVWEIRNINATLGLDKWRIYDVASDTCKIDQYMSGTVPDNPWEVPAWQNKTSPYAHPDLVLTPIDSANTWSGYKAVFDSTAGTWSFESGVTAGLAYTNVTPIVGGIYSADALVIVSLLYTGTPTLTSPTGMTSESSDEWEISAKSNYNAYYPWKAFDGLSSPFTNCWSSQTAKDQWLQWHNKKQKVLVQRLKLSVTDAPAQGPAEFILQGSDDGTLWHDIHSESGLSWTTNGEAKEFAFSNNKSYYYHRLNEMWADSNVVSILELETYDM